MIILRVIGAERFFILAGALMNTDERGYFDALTERVLGAGRPGAAEASFPVIYKGHGVGEYFAHILVEDVLVIELKCAERLSNAVSELFAGIGPDAVSSRQFPETQGRVEANRQRISHPRAD